MYRLALALGVWDVHGLLRRMSMPQLLEWLRFSELEPFGEDRDDYRTGAIVNVLANINRRRGRKPFTMEESTPRFGDAKVAAATAATAKPVAKSWQTMKMIGQMMTQSSQMATAKSRRSKRGA